MLAVLSQGAEQAAANARYQHADSRSWYGMGTYANASASRASGMRSVLQRQTVLRASRWNDDQLPRLPVYGEEMECRIFKGILWHIFEVAFIHRPHQLQTCLTLKSKESQ